MLLSLNFDMPGENGASQVGIANVLHVVVKFSSK